MQKEMSFSVNGQPRVPPGFRFHPTEEELLHYYLRKKVAFMKIDFDVIPDIDLNKFEPWEIEDTCRIGSTPQNEWYFFSHRDMKYPTGKRTNRATAAGFWKATGRDKPIFLDFKQIGMRKTLVFYIGRAPHGKNSDWIIHEYRLEDNVDTNRHSNAASHDEAAQEEGWVVCRIFKKKNHKKVVHPCSDSHRTALDSGECNISNQFLPPRRPPENSQFTTTHAGCYFEESCCCFYSSMALDMHEAETEGRIIRECLGSTSELEAKYHVQNWARLERLVTVHLDTQEGTSEGVGLLGEAESIGSDIFNACNACEEGFQLPHRLHRAHEHSLDHACEIELWNLLLEQGYDDDVIENAVFAAQSAERIDSQNMSASAMLNKIRLVSRARARRNDLLISRKCAKACLTYGEGFQLDPSSAVLYNNRAACRFKLGKWE